MQWLIDIIIADIRKSFGCFNRGDNSSWDFTIGDFTQDDTWHDLDLSGIVPENTVAVNVKVNLRATAIEATFDLRTKDFVNVVNTLRIWTQAAQVRIGGVFRVDCNEDRVIQYRIDRPIFNAINLNINGWWLR